jgi:hypothetical protein
VSGHTIDAHVSTAAGLPGVLLLTAGVGCSSPYGETPPPSPSPEELASRADGDLSDLGTRSFSVPASAAGIATWDVYMNSDILVVGADSTQSMVAAMVFTNGGGDKVASVCATRSPATRCSDIASAIATDFGAGAPKSASALHASALHVLDAPPAVGSCPGILNKAMGLPTWKSDPAKTTGKRLYYMPEMTLPDNVVTSDQVKAACCQPSGSEQSGSEPSGSAGGFLIQGPSDLALVHCPSSLLAPQLF